MPRRYQPSHLMCIGSENRHAHLTEKKTLHTNAHEPGCEAPTLNEARLEPKERRAQPATEWIAYHHVFSIFVDRR